MESFMELSYTVARGRGVEGVPLESALVDTIFAEEF
jgi:hypothetical protein